MACDSPVGKHPVSRLLQASQGSFLPGALPKSHGNSAFYSLCCEAGPTEVRAAEGQCWGLTEAVTSGVICGLGDSEGGGSQPRAALPEGSSSKGLEVVAVGL